MQDKSVTVKLHHRDTLESLRDMGKRGDSVNDIIEKHFLKNASKRDTQHWRLRRSQQLPRRNSSIM